MDLVEPDAGDGALDDDVHAGRDLLGEVALVVDVLGDVGLGEHDDRPGAGLPREHELALEAAHVDALARERLDDEYHVDVGDEYLLVGLLAGVLARERARARKDGFDDGLVVALGNRKPDPVTDDGARSRAVRLDEVGGRLGSDRALLGDDEREGAIDSRDATGDEPGLGERREESGLALGPAEFGERWCGDVVGVWHGAKDSA